MSTDDVSTDAIESVGILTDPVRRSLYSYVVAQPEPIGREKAATATGISRSLAAFHLDRLVDAELLTTTFRRLSGRSGPGAGRPAKLYARAPREHAVTLPPRRYDLAAELLASAVEKSKPARVALASAARKHGLELARGAQRPADDDELLAVTEVLVPLGYEPRVENGSVVLANCPFHALVESHNALVCGANLALLSGVVEGLGATGLEAVLEPAQGRCCVVVMVS